ncbi:MAG: hypothetical protein RXR74_03705, partial [Nitrososphaeria archaeon]
AVTKASASSPFGPVFSDISGLPCGGPLITAGERACGEARPRAARYRYPLERSRSQHVASAARGARNQKMSQLRRRSRGPAEDPESAEDRQSREPGPRSPSA